MADEVSLEKSPGRGASEKCSLFSYIVHYLVDFHTGWKILSKFSIIFSLICNHSVRLVRLHSTHILRH
eukprot:470735-Amphidinium_carterae.1